MGRGEWVNKEKANEKIIIFGWVASETKSSETKRAFTRFPF